MKVEIVTGEHCSYCEGAKQILKVRGIEYKELSVMDKDGMKLMSEHNLRSVPQIFIDDKLIENGYHGLQIWALNDAGD